MVYTIDVYDKSWKIVSNVELNKDVFTDENVNESLIHEYYLLQRSNGRIAIAHTKTRGEVNGSGKKLYAQKGTGNARVGDKKSPIRRTGGVAFGPRSERNFEKSMPKKARRHALCGLLTLKAKNAEILGFTGFDYKEPKTKNAVDLLEKIGLTGKKTLVVLDKKDNVVEKSFKNIDRVKYLLVDYLNPLDLMHYDKVLFTDVALEKINVK